MFEKSLYDLIRGLRNHRGHEREYIQNSLRECRREIKSQDMDVKATALLKLTYLEMFGHDMSWASFNTLEVMSSPKYLQKRVGYLGAVQSFRPDTEVLMLAENCLKKDLSSASLPTISLPLSAIPHVISPSMANSLLSDILPRLTHSNASIRKKTIVTLYRLALVYPETLRPAWPKIKDRLLDEAEDPSVTSAVVNVVCELGWRRPEDFLPLAPRLFELLVEGSNNWMAIKIIKLFATLTPLEPRLVKKLLPQLTSILKTTPAMSLLYECINGVIQGGILESAAGTTEGDEIARLCVGKLRGMLVIEGDPNLKFVALLAFNKIVQSHPDLVSEHEDVILECIDDGDISIRLRALDLVVGMVNGDNLMSIVGRLISQLRNAPEADLMDDASNDRGYSGGITPTADFDDDESEQSMRLKDQKVDQPTALPDEYRLVVLQRILEMCGRGTYANMSDFDWYVEVLKQLVKYIPVTAYPSSYAVREAYPIHDESKTTDIACDIGFELRNVAVRVKASRTEAVRAAEALVSVNQRDRLFPSITSLALGVLEPAAWIVGEFAVYLIDPAETLNSLVHSINAHLPAKVISAYLQAIPKIFTVITSSYGQIWTRERISTVTLLIARIVHSLEPLTNHPGLEVQERAVEYLELLRLATEAVAGQKFDADHDLTDPPLLISQAMPSLFAGMELNPVAAGAQKKVPLPDGLDMDKPINEHLTELLEVPDLEFHVGRDNDFDNFYNQRSQTQHFQAEPAATRLDLPEPVVSYQQIESDLADPETAAKRKAERSERYKDDPFYIPSEGRSGTSTPGRDMLKTYNGEELDIDSIPVMELNLEGTGSNTNLSVRSQNEVTSASRKFRRNFEILADENIGDEQNATSSNMDISTRKAQAKRSVLQVDSSGLGSLSLEGGQSGSQLDIERHEAEEAEMAKALREVERLRREMERAAARVQAKDLPAEGTLVKPKKKKKTKLAESESVGQSSNEPAEAAAEDTIVKKKKKKKKVQTSEDLEGGVAKVVAPKKIKKQQVMFDAE